VSKAVRRALPGLALLLAALILSRLPGSAAGAVAGSILALFLPGYGLMLCLRTSVRLGRLLDVLDCVAGSLAVSPLALRLVGVVFPFDRPHVVGLLVGVSAALLALGAARSRSAAALPVRRTAPSVVAMVGLTLLLLAPTLAIGPTTEGGETRVKGWDLNNHLAMAESIAARGLPPTNPFLATEAPFYYHTFFHVLLGAILVVAGPAAHSYLLISLLTLLAAGAFLSTFHRVVSDMVGDERVALFSLPLVSLVGGFDLIPMAGRALLLEDGLASPLTFFLRHWNVDGWVSNRGMLVPSLFASFYWVPHAVAALVVLLLALLYLRRSDADPWAMAPAAVCLASMAGYNGYVALGGAAIVVLDRGIDLARRFESGLRAVRGAFLRGALTGGLAILLSLPVLHLYLGQNRDLAKFRWASPGPLVPLQVLLEFGPALLLGVAGVVFVLRRKENTSGVLPFFLMVAVSLPLICLVASTGENNDLAMRVSLLLWIGLAVFGGIALARLFPAPPAPARTNRTARYAVFLALTLGGLSVAWFAAGASVAKPAFGPDEIVTGRWVRTHVAWGGRVQGSPLRDNPDLVYLTGHGAVLSDTWAARLFYSSPEDFSRRMASLREAFSSEDARVACSSLRSLQVEAVVVGPREERDFPILARRDPMPCLAEAFRRGTYRVYRLLP
jgi:hypothetical protein